MNQTMLKNQSEVSNRAIWWSGFIDGFIALPIICFAVGYVAVQAGCLPVAGRWFVQTNEIHKAGAIIVLAGGGPERLCHGIELFKRGMAPELWYTGNKSPVETRSDFMDSELALNFAVQQGLPRDKIGVLPSTSTYEDGKAIEALVKENKIKSIIVLTSWYHTRRAANVIKHSIAGQNTPVYMCSSTNLPYTPDNWWQNEEGMVTVVNEMIKTAFYWWRYGIVPF